MEESPVPMRVLIAPNAFKGTLSGAQAASAIREGVAAARPGALCRKLPLADGGDGFLETVLSARSGELVPCQVAGPLLEPALASYGWMPNATASTAVIELAQACGLKLVAQPSPATSARATTTGLGELLRHALDRRPRTILIGLGGSATTDGGSGLATALGFSLLDRQGRPIGPGGIGLIDLDRIDASGADPRLAETVLVAACDVDSPLTGPQGAAVLFAPQKGADRATVRVLERGIRLLEDIVERDLRRSGLAERPGAGAAGGAAFGLAAFCGARFEKGVSLVARLVGLDAALEEADLVITGEGHFDETSLSGKVTGEVLRRSAQRGLPCLVLVGSADPAWEVEVRELGGWLVRTSPNRTIRDGTVITSEVALSQLRATATRALLELEGGALTV
ncbi:MAG: glycerate kinase [Candidatus Dormiibacterota bacterium]